MPGAYRSDEPTTVPLRGSTSWRSITPDHSGGLPTARRLRPSRPNGSSRSVWATVHQMGGQVGRGRDGAGRPGRGGWCRSSRGARGGRGGQVGVYQACWDGAGTEVSQPRPSPGSRAVQRSGYPGYPNGTEQDPDGGPPRPRRTSSTRTAGRRRRAGTPTTPNSMPHARHLATPGPRPQCLARATTAATAASALPTGPNLRRGRSSLSGPCSSPSQAILRVLARRRRTSLSTPLSGARSLGHPLPAPSCSVHSPAGEVGSVSVSTADASSAVASTGSAVAALSSAVFVPASPGLEWPPVTSPGMVCPLSCVVPGPALSRRARGVSTQGCLGPVRVSVDAAGVVPASRRRHGRERRQRSNHRFHHGSSAHWPGARCHRRPILHPPRAPR